tara:strand:- start:217 stop:1368 length:1152 start_codon:yes stop_codon:yes gene_type:complete
MHIFYWSPFISKVATVSSVIRSAESVVKYSKKKVEVSLIDAIGEWHEYEKKIHPEVKIIKLNKKDYYNYLPRGGFLKSRLSYLIIFFLNFNKLKNLINNKNPNFLIIHLMTSLPILLTLFFKSNTKIILRLSGLPKLNILRYFFWKIFSKNIYKVTCPTLGTYNNLLKKGIFDKNKLCLLRDPVIRLKDFSNKKSEKIENFNYKDKKYIVSIGRLTKQKNFNLLINGFNQIQKKYHEYELIIIGDGEKKIELSKLIKSYKLEKKIHLVGYQKNVYKYLKIADCFILTSLWEDPGFVLIEAGLSNKTVISSNCNHGPEEILKNGKNGYLFKNDSLKSFLDKFDEFKNDNKINISSKKLNLKKELKKFTFFSHFSSLKNIINLKY